MVDQIKTYISVAEYETLPDSRHPIQLIEGELFDLVPPLANHQLIASQLAHMLWQLRGDGKVVFAPMAVYLDEQNVFEPDVMWLAPNSQAAIVRKGIRGVPELVIEILSVSTARVDKVIKFRLYEEHGAREYWLVDPARFQVEVWRRDDPEFVLVGTFGPADSFVSPILERTIDLKPIFSDLTED